MPKGIDSMAVVEGRPRYGMPLFRFTLEASPPDDGEPTNGRRRKRTGLCAKCGAKLNDKRRRLCRECAAER